MCLGVGPAQDEAVDAITDELKLARQAKGHRLNRRYESFMGMQEPIRLLSFNPSMNH